MAERVPLLLHGYRLLTAALSPLTPLLLNNRLRRGKPRTDDGRAIAQHIEADEPRLLLKHQLFLGAALRSENEGGADIGMAGKRQFCTRSKNPHFRRMR